MSKKKSKSKNNKKSSNGVKMLPISIVMFIILSAVALFIILNKGNILGYSLVKIQTSSAEESSKADEKKENKMEIIADKKYLSSKKSEKTELIVTINGEEIDLNEVELTSSNKDAIKIKDGIATAVSDGKSTITATKDDLTASIDLRAITPIKSMTFSTTNSVVRVGRSLQMKLVAQPSDASIETLKYKSSDEEIATVNANGIVTGIAPGNVTITVTDTYSEIEKSIKLTIRK